MKRSTVVIAHLVFWGVGLLPSISFHFLRSLSFNKILQANHILYPVVFYAGYFLAIRLININKRQLLVSAICIAVTVIILFMIFAGGAVKIILSVLFILFATSFNFIAGFFFRFFIDWFSKNKEREALEKQHLKSELDLLRFQINPHFLFNTLNNIDTLIRKDQQKASQSLIKVADIMRYMLHDSSAERVKLGDELHYLEDYIDLEKLRLSHPGLVGLECTGDPGEIEVAPMLFIPFIENAFKHSPVLDGATRIKIIFNIGHDQVDFTCINTIASSAMEKDSSSGIGLSTVRKRLNLLYPGKYRLDDRKTGDYYRVDLRLTT